MWRRWYVKIPSEKRAGIIFSQVNIDRAGWGGRRRKWSIARRAGTAQADKAEVNQSVVSLVSTVVRSVLSKASVTIRRAKWASSINFSSPGSSSSSKWTGASTTPGRSITTTGQSSTQCGSPSPQRWGSLVSVKSAGRAKLGGGGTALISTLRCKYSPRRRATRHPSELDNSRGTHTDFLQCGSANHVFMQTVTENRVRLLQEHALTHAALGYLFVVIRYRPKYSPYIQFWG